MVYWEAGHVHAIRDMRALPASTLEWKRATAAGHPGMTARVLATVPTPDRNVPHALPIIMALPASIADQTHATVEAPATPLETVPAVTSGCPRFALPAAPTATVPTASSALAQIPAPVVVRARRPGLVSATSALPGPLATNANPITGVSIARLAQEVRVTRATASAPVTPGGTGTEHVRARRLTEALPASTRLLPPSPQAQAARPVAIQSPCPAFTSFLARQAKG